MFGVGKDDQDAHATVWHSVWMFDKYNMLVHRTYKATVRHYELKKASEDLERVMQFKPSESAEVHKRSWDFEERFLASRVMKK